MRAPEPIVGQHPDDCRRETLRTLKRKFLQNHQLGTVNMRDLGQDALQPIENQVLNAVVVEAYNPKNVPIGELRKVEKLDDYGKLTEINWIGQESFIKLLPDYRPGRRVTSFRTEQGYLDATGRPLR